MQALIACTEGLEAVTLSELERWGKGVKIRAGWISIGVKSREEIADLAVRLQSALGVWLFVDEFSFASLDDLVRKVGDIDFTRGVDGSFAVRCDHRGAHAFNSQEVERACGAVLFEKLKIPVNLERPKYTVSVILIDDYCFVGIDFVGFRLSKRDYRVKITASSLNPCLAFVMVQLAGWNPKEVLLDPLCKTGEVAIEACLQALDIPPFVHVQEKFLFARFLEYRAEAKAKEIKLKILAYDALHMNVRSAEVNAKLALVREHLTFSRTDLDWLDTKFEEGGVDKVVTVLPLPSRFTQYKDFDKLCKEFFYQCAYILHAQGGVVVLARKPEVVEKHALAHGFMKSEEYVLNAQVGTIMVFRK